MYTNHQEPLKLIGGGAGHWLWCLKKTLWPSTWPGGLGVDGEQVAEFLWALTLSPSGRQEAGPCSGGSVCAGIPGQWAVEDGWKVCLEKVGGGL